MGIQEITSLQNSLVKHLVKLRENKAYRQECRAVTLSGIKLIQELSLHHRFSTLLIQVDTPLPQGIKADQIVYVTPAILKKVTGLENPEPLAVEIQMPSPREVVSAPLLLILDGISDPGNLGTLLRTTQGLGWDGVFITEGSVDPFNEKALRAAKGATFTCPWQIGSHEELQALLAKRGGALFTADAKGASLTTLSFHAPLALILGNEAHGPTPFFKRASQLVAIEMQKEMESLNVASAGAILMHQIKRSVT